MRERRLLKPVEGAGLTFQAPLSFGLGVGVDLDEPGVCRRVMSLIFFYFLYSLKKDPYKVFFTNVGMYIFQ